VAGVAGLLVATDFLLIAQSRVAMLDIFSAFFVVLGFLFLSIDRDRILQLREYKRLPFPGEAPRRMPEWRLLAGAAFGAGVAVKWQAGLALIVGALIAISWSVGLLRMRALAPNEEGRQHPFRREIGVLASGFLLIPLLLYLASYGLWFKDNYPHKCAEGQTQRIFLTNQVVGCRTGILGTALAFGELQRSMLDFHTKLEARHPYASPAHTWPLVLRPVAFYYEGDPKSAHVLAFGNPATWWAALGAALWLVVLSWRPWKPQRFVLAAWAGQYLPWLGAISRPAIFLFYMTPIVPFMMLGLAGALGSIRDTGRVGRWAVIAYLALGVGVLLWYFYPIIAAVGLPYDWWYDRMWLRGRWI
jgi:dolichyl-phosphate-mannose--protein O-mannosyl transferase